MNLTQPLISVIVTVYNAEEFVEETLESILVQTYPNIEIIVVNDGSTDQSLDIIRNIKDERILIFTTSNMGQCVASNYGLSKAKGDYIKFFDADDLMNPSHLENQLRNLGNSKTKIASCAWGRFYDGNPASARFIPETVWKNMKPLDWLKAALYQKNDMMGAWLWLIPKEILKKAGGWNEQLSLNNDFEFSIRLLLHAEEVSFTSEARVYYRSGLSNTLSQTLTKEKYEAAFLSTRLGCSYLIRAEDSPEMRRICADRYQEWLFRMYPAHPQLQKIFQQEIDKYGGSDRKMDGGKLFHLLSFLGGWKAAKRIKSFLRR